MRGMDSEKMGMILNLAACGFIFSIIISFILLALRKKVDMFSSFIDGAKEGFKVAIKIIPYLVAMLVAIATFRASGALDFVINAIGTFVSLFTDKNEFVGALPTAFMKPLSGSGARAMMVEAMNNYGVDSFVSKLAGTFQGSTETTFYTLAVYYGAVNIKRTRYTVTCGLIADFAGIVTAIFVAYYFFG